MEKDKIIESGKTIKQKLFDVCPCWLYRSYRWIKERPRYIKWWFQRANGKIPACDWWDFDISLANYIEQGLYNLLYNGCRDWSSKIDSKEYRELLFIYNFMKDYKEEKSLYVSKEWFRNYQKRKAKAFRLLGKYLESLWD